MNDKMKTTYKELVKSIPNGYIIEYFKCKVHGYDKSGTTVDPIYDFEYKIKKIWNTQYYLWLHVL